MTPVSIVKGVSDIAEFLSLENPNMRAPRRRGRAEVEGMSQDELEKLIITLEEMFAAAEELRFEYAARIARRDQGGLRREAHRPCRHRSPGGLAMCRNIRPLHNFEPPATREEIHDAALQYVRKVSGSTKPSKANEAAFARAVEEVTAASTRLLDALVRRRRRATARSRPRGLGHEPRSVSARPRRLAEWSARSSRLPSPD